MLRWLPVCAQNNLTDRLFLDLPPDTFITITDSLTDSLKLPDHFLIPRSDKIYRNNFRLIRGVHYNVNDRMGVIDFLRSVVAGDSITVIYQKYPFPLIPDYYRRELQFVQLPDSLKGREHITGKVVGSRFLEDIDAYGSNLEKSGSIVRGIEIGTNRDLTLNSGLNLQLSGYITPELQVVAALTDESTPIQPEGNTQTLREVDKVFVKIISPHIGGTLGDFNLSYQNSFFGNLNRKLQGISAYGEFRQYNQQLTYATTRGTFTTNQFLGQEGNQGPYQLSGKNGERDIIVLAGTERIYVNGELLIRGENNQYIIDYSLGQITFTNNRLITGDDRIEVDFEYSDNFQRYGKSFVGLSSRKGTPGPGFSYDVRLFREWDDTKNLLEDSSPLTPEEQEVLARAGDNQLAASVSGADSVGPGEGNYVKRDTLIGVENYKYFRYTGAGNGNFNVRFSSVGQGNGSYLRERLGIYRFLGPGRGDYLPIKLIPLAGDKKLADLTLSYKLGNNLNLIGEGAVSLYDRNVFSSLDDNNNLGNAFTFGTNYFNDETELFGTSLGVVNWQLKWRRQEKEFSPLDRQFQPEFNYKWNLNSTTLQNDENTIESTLTYFPKQFMQFKLDNGYIQRGTEISSRRTRGDINISDSSLVKLEGYYELIDSKNLSQESNWQRSGSLIGKQFGRFFPYVGYSQQDRTVTTSPEKISGFYFQNGDAGLNIKTFLGLRWFLLSRIRDDYLYDPYIRNQRRKLARSYTHSLEGAFIQSRKWQGRMSFVYRQKNYEPFFKNLAADSIPVWQPDPQFQDTSWGNKQSHLGRIELQYINEPRTVDSRWQYRVASELQALQEKVFIFVGENRGNYRFDDYLQEYVPDPQGDYVQVILSTGNFEAVTNIEASWQIRYRPKKESAKYEGLQNVFRNISFYSLVKVNEKSRESEVWELYLLNLKKFHNPSTTLRGTYALDQDIYFFERNPQFGITLRSRYRDNLSNEFVESGFNETLKNWDRSISWRQSLIARKLSHELEYLQSIVTRKVASIPSRGRDIFGHTGALILNYRPVYAWQIQTRIEGAFQKDRAVLNKLTVRYFELRPQINYAIAGKARAQLSADFIDVKVLDNPFGRPVPFEMAKGKREGLSILWNIRFEYFISGNITTTFNFTGRRDAGSQRAIYLGQAEIRAFF